MEIKRTWKNRARSESLSETIVNLANPIHWMVFFISLFPMAIFVAEVMIQWNHHRWLVILLTAWIIGAYIGGFFTDYGRGPFAWIMCTAAKCVPGIIFWVIHPITTFVYLVDFFFLQVPHFIFVDFPKMLLNKR